VRSYSVNKTLYIHRRRDSTVELSRVGGVNAPAAEAGLKVQEGSGRVRHQWLPSPPLTKKILTGGFLCFAWTPLSSSGKEGPDPWTPLPRPATPLERTRRQS